MSTDGRELPVLFFDSALPEPYVDLVAGRARAVGPDTGLDEADAVIAGARLAWDAARIAGAPRVRVISRIGVGYDNVDVVAAASAKVVVCNAPMAPTVSTAEHTVALVLAVTKHLPEQLAWARAGRAATGTGRALELDGSVLGLIGFGRIARRVAAAAQGLGMRVIAYDPLLLDSSDPTVQLTDLDSVFANADVVSLHCPATDATRHMVDARRIATMKRGAYFVNCARGSLVDQDALLGALERGHLAGAALDVTDPEPLPSGHPLLARDDVIVTPHVASSTIAGRRRLYEHAIENALAVLEGRPATIVPIPGHPAAATTEST
jgi:D-3-phosphoglycerate dehydrogenase / 2-oxoglutarate reductase